MLTFLDCLKTLAQIVVMCGCVMMTLFFGQELLNEGVVHAKQRLY